MLSVNPWADLNASRQRAVEEYEMILDALEKALEDPLAATAGAMKRQNECWGALLFAARESGAALSSAVRTTEARLNDAAAAGESAVLDEALTKRLVAAMERTAVLSEGIRRRRTVAAEEASKRRKRRPSHLRYSRNEGRQLDIKV